MTLFEAVWQVLMMAPPWVWLYALPGIIALGLGMGVAAHDSIQISKGRFKGNE